MKVSLLGTLMVIVCTSYNCLYLLGQTIPPSAQQQASKDVDVIVQEILNRGQGKVDDVVTSTWVPPSEEDVSRIRKLGHNAIEPLNNISNSQIPFRQLLAVRLLEEIGGTDVVPPLKRGLEPNRWVVVRMQALCSLRSAPDDLAVPIIRAARCDPDNRVAERATTLLSMYYKLDEPAKTCSQK